MGELPEDVGGCAAITQGREDVLDDWMPDHVHVHGSPSPKVPQASSENSLAAAFLRSSGIAVACLFSTSRSTHLNSVLIAMAPVATFLSRC
jgi:hypothetical protein